VFRRSLNRSGSSKARLPLVAQPPRNRISFEHEQLAHSADVMGRKTPRYGRAVGVSQQRGNAAEFACVARRRHTRNRAPVRGGTGRTHRLGPRQAGASRTPRMKLRILLTSTATAARPPADSCTIGVSCRAHLGRTHAPRSMWTRPANRAQAEAHGAEAPRLRSWSRTLPSAPNPPFRPDIPCSSQSCMPSPQVT
jgi:hypothetical protein